MCFVNFGIKLWYLTERYIGPDFQLRLGKRDSKPEMRRGVPVMNTVSWVFV